MPINPALRWYYPIDWQELSAAVRFDRAGGRCEQCRRPHGQTIHHLGDGRWFDPHDELWRNDRGQAIDWPAYRDYVTLKQMKVVLATAHLDHDPGNNRPRNLKALCRRSASAAIFAMIGGSIEGGRGSPSSSGGRSVICSMGLIQLDQASAWLGSNALASHG